MGGGSNSKAKGQPRAMAPVAEVDIAAVRYEPRPMQAPHLTGFGLRAFVWLLESRLLGPILLSALKKQNNMTQVLPSSILHPSPLFVHCSLLRLLKLTKILDSLGARVQMLQNTVIPERPMYYPEFPPQGTAARHILCVAPLNSSMEYPFFFLKSSMVVCSAGQASSQGNKILLELLLNIRTKMLHSSFIFC
jgi:hypothetical protein